MGAMAAQRWLLAGVILAVESLVDEYGRYRTGGDLSSLAPPEPSEEDRKASIDISKQPVEKLFRLLVWELSKEERRKPELRLGVQQFQALSELGCVERLVHTVEGAQRVSAEVKEYHINITGTAGLYWLLYQYPEEHSWVWLLTLSHQRVLRKVWNYMSLLSLVARGEDGRCLPAHIRTIAMNAAATWRSLHGDYIALLWNGVAFGILGDVTSWREYDEETATTEEGPGGPPPNVSWSENLIFGNMWLSSVSKWLEAHAGELSRAVLTDVARQQQGLPDEAELSAEWLRSRPGMPSAFEFLRRHTFAHWELDRGLLRGLLRHVLRPGFGESPRPSVGDFGAGSGRYSAWLNDTGLVEAFAFDGAMGAEDITGGVVQEVDLAPPDRRVETRLWRGFDWVLCLGVAEHLPEGKVPALLRTVKQHAAHGLVLSWHGKAEADLAALVGLETAFVLDRTATDALRQACELEHLAPFVAVFRAPT